MRKKLLSCLLAGSLCLALMPVTALADGQKVVTLGVDLTEDQKTAVLKYFGVLGQNIETLYITNQDEREHLGSYVPLEQIGTRTFSCALVCPTNSGGIQVKTANLSWVTSNMIASTLSTSGVVNCDVLAASPFEVSGTGALTGIIMAYESASGVTLDPVKKELATQELIATGTIANEVGQQQATNIVNEIKIQVIQNAVEEPDEVEQIVDEVVDENPEVELSDEDRALLTGLMTQIAEQQYNYEEMKDTLQRVEENVNGLTDQMNGLQQGTEAAPSAGEETPQLETTQPETLASDSILMNTDDTALGEQVNIDATNSEAVPEETQPATEATPVDGFEITTTDTYSDPNAGGNAEGGDSNEQNGENVDIWNGETAETTAPEYVENVSPDPAVNTDDGYTDFGEIPAGEFTDDGTTIPQENPEQPTDGEAVPEVPALELSSCKRTPDSSDSTMAYVGDSRIRLTYENDNLVPVSGTLTLTDAWGNVCSTVNLADREQVSAGPIYDENTWGTGTDILINLGTALQADGSYTVAVEGILAQTTDPSVLENVPTAAINETWQINTARYGAGLNTQRVTDTSVGATVSGNVYFDETMTYAVISAYDEYMISFDTTEFSPEASSFNMNCLQQGTTSFTVDYYNVDGEYVISCDIEVTIR